MRFHPDYPPETHQPVPIDRAVTLLMPAELYDQLLSELAAADSSAAALPDRAPGLAARVLGFLLRPN